MYPEGPYTDPNYMTPEERWRLNLELLRQQYTNAAQTVRNSMDQAQAGQYLDSTNLNFMGDRNQTQLREAGMSGDIMRQQQNNNRYGWGLEQDVAQAQLRNAQFANQEVTSPWERAKRMLGY